LHPQEALEQIMKLGGFPEPFLSGSETRAKRWRKQYLERVVREDLQDLESIRDIQALLLLTELLRERVGSPISYKSLAEDIQVSPHTVKKWIGVLEKMYIVFSVTPYHKNIARAILKEPKIYFFDSGLVRGNGGVILENIVAVSLLKHLHFLEDTQGEDTQLHYLRDKEKREVDFVTVINGKVTNLIEVKLASDNLEQSLLYYHRRFPKVPSTQLVCSLDRARTVEGIQIEPAAKWLAGLAI
jgi:predicted AAA+ superfamily ATPase